MKLPLNEKQFAFLKSLGIEDKDYTKDEIEEDVIDVLVSCLCSKGFENSETYDKTNNIGNMCEEIIDILEENLG